ncbi:unnamed protein product [Amoebophrya sp. A120]|nr:unnamed protein product [Amoebophrya sp. A120]|eukprot:GSA120T00015425001.1
MVPGTEGGPSSGGPSEAIMSTGFGSHSYNAHSHGQQLRGPGEELPLLKDWTQQMEQARVWRILKAKMLTPWRSQGYCRALCAFYVSLIAYLVTVSYVMSTRLQQHPVPSRNWGCHYIHQLPSAFLRIFLVPIPLASLLFGIGVLRYPLTTWMNALVCFCHAFCGLCIAFIFIVDELPGFEAPLDSYGFRSYTPFHFVPATVGYCFVEAGRDIACLVAIADAVVVTMTYKQWRKSTADHEEGEGMKMASTLMKNGFPKEKATLSEYMQKQVALYQKRQWTIQAFHKLVLVMQGIAVMAVIVILRVLYVLYLHGAHHWVFLVFGFIPREDAHFSFQADFSPCSIPYVSCRLPWCEKKKHPHGFSWIA